MRIPAILAALALSASALATLAFAQTAPAPTDEEVAAALKTYNAETVVGTASGVDVTLGDLALALASLPPQVRGAPMEQIAPALRRQVMDETILAKMAKDAGLENDPRVARRLAAITRSFLAETYLVQEIEKQVTDEALKAAYAEATKDFKPEAKVHARHILVKTEDEAKALVEELKGGKDFAELAAEKSTGPSGPRGGDLGWFTIDQMVGPFAEAAFAQARAFLPCNTFESLLVWSHIFLVLDKPIQHPMVGDEMTV